MSIVLELIAPEAFFRLGMSQGFKHGLVSVITSSGGNDTSVGMVVAKYGFMFRPRGLGHDDEELLLEIFLAFFVLPSDSK